MKTYKNFYGSKEEYINFCRERVTFWAKAFAKETDAKRRNTWALELDEAERTLAAEGIDWEEIEQLESEMYKTA